MATSQTKVNIRKTSGGGLPGFLRMLEIDVRLLGMVGVLLLLWFGFHVAFIFKNDIAITSVGDFFTTGFLSPRNLWNLAVQTSVVGIIATGMVFVIVMRHIDLSVGSVLGFTGMIMAVLQTQALPVGASWNWLATLALGLVAGALIGAFQGYWIAYQLIPSFIVTLAGLLIFRGGAWLMTQGRTVAPLDSNFQLLGGGLNGSIGAFWSWMVGLVAIVAIILLAFQTRGKRARLGFPVRPLWAEVLVGLAAIAAVAGFVLIMNAYNRPRTEIAQGIPIPVLVLIGVALLMTGVARLTKFGRYVYAMGGSPEAAQLAGIDTKRMTLFVFMLIGALSALAGAVATARLNSGVNSTGTLTELYVIAAAVIGGTSLAGGYGTVVGAIIGAVFMQSLQSGMVLLNLNSSLIQVIIGLVLIAAVWIDVLYRRRSGLTEG
ncbi:sugar ABC transporter permease [soil metagenome]